MSSNHLLQQCYKTKVYVSFIILNDAVKKKENLDQAKHRQGTHSKSLAALGVLGRPTQTSYSSCGVPPAQLAHLKKEEE